MVDFEDDIKNCVKALNEGGVILYPTETVWGLGCDALNAEAVERVFALKQRPANKSMIILLAEARDVIQFVAAPHPDIISIVERFERPTTVVYDGGLDFPSNVLGRDGSVAIRVTSDPFCKALIKRLRKPIISTSANLSGQPTPELFVDIDRAIITGADYVVRHRQDDSTKRPPSRIVRIDDNGGLLVLRD